MSDCEAAWEPMRRRGYGTHAEATAIVQRDSHRQAREHAKALTFGHRMSLDPALRREGERAMAEWDRRNPRPAA